MSRSDPQINLRIPAPLKARLEEVARANRRSLNAEILERLARSLEGSPSRDDAIAVDDRRKAFLHETRDGGVVEVVAPRDMELTRVRAVVAAWLASPE